MYEIFKGKKYKYSSYDPLRQFYPITRKSVDGEPSHIPALIKANRIEASYFLAYNVRCKIWLMKIHFLQTCNIVCASN